ncbi:MAG: hypothetical protein RI922_485 [Bacteroidota bacterium]|jgi:hypothetical protein
MKTKKLTLTRKLNFALSGRKFKVIIDGEEVDELSTNQTKTIEISDAAQELKINVMNYESKRINLSAVHDNDLLEIKQNVLSTISSILVAIGAGAFLISKFIFENENPVILYVVFPFVVLSIYFSNLGRKQVIQIKKITSK